MDVVDWKSPLITLFKLKKDSPFYFENHPVYLFKVEYSFIPLTSLQYRGPIMGALENFYISFPGFQEYCAPINMSSKAANYDEAELHKATNEYKYSPNINDIPKGTYISVVTVGYLSSECIGAISEADMFSIQFAWSYNDKIKNFYEPEDMEYIKMEKTYRNISIKSISNKPYDEKKKTVYKKVNSLTILDTGKNKGVNIEINDSDLLFQANDIWNIECEKNYTFHNALIGFFYIPLDNVNIIKIQNLTLKINNQTFENLNFYINKQGTEFDTKGNRTLDKYSLELVDSIEFNPLKGKFETLTHSLNPGLFVPNYMISAKGSLSFEFVTNNYENKLSTIKNEIPIDISRKESQITYQTDENNNEIISDNNNKVLITKEQITKYSYKEITYEDFKEIFYGNK